MWWGNTRAIKRSVRIIAVPPGEAPLWVREKWVGLTLPLTHFSSAKTFVGFGVLSGPRTFLPQLLARVRGRSDRIYGFLVNAARAVEILDHASPEAAAWWRENASELVLPKRYLVFHAEVCEVVIE
jgi:hypothetical protein